VKEAKRIVRDGQLNWCVEIRWEWEQMENRVRVTRRSS
jgi:hypothetical protein